MGASLDDANYCMHRRIKDYIYYIYYIYYISLFLFIVYLSFDLGGCRKMGPHMTPPKTSKVSKWFGRFQLRERPIWRGQLAYSAQKQRLFCVVDVQVVLCSDIVPWKKLKLVHIAESMFVQNFSRSCSKLVHRHIYFLCGFRCWWAFQYSSIHEARTDPTLLQMQQSSCFSGTCQCLSRKFGDVEHGILLISVITVIPVVACSHGK